MCEAATNQVGIGEFRVGAHGVRTLWLKDAILV